MIEMRRRVLPAREFRSAEASAGGRAPDSVAARRTPIPQERSTQPPQVYSGFWHPALCSDQSLLPKICAGWPAVRRPGSHVVPEATVDEDRGFSGREYNVGLARRVAAMEAESLAPCVKLSANEEFRLGVLRANGRHHLAALLRCDAVQASESS